MKTTLSILLLLLFISPVWGQNKKRGQVKQKYRNAETVSRELPPVFMRGTVYDEQYNPVSGAMVTVDGTSKGVNTNTNGEYILTGLLTGRARLRVSFIGYKIHTSDMILQAGKNEKNVMLLQDEVHLEPTLVSAQKRDQQILDVPLALSAVTQNQMQNLNITDLEMLSNFVPGLYISEQGAMRTAFTIRGLSSDDESLSAQPRIAVYFNNVAINRGDATSLALYDMERVEVLKGPQNVLFGRSAQAGAIHYVSKLPGSEFGGNLSVGIGDFGRKEVRGAFNLPIIEHKLAIRAAGIYNTFDGFVANTFGGTLMGAETLAGRFSVRFNPAWDHDFNLVLNYQKDQTPGVAYMSNIFPNTEGMADIFSGLVSHEQGTNLGTGKEILDATLNYKYYLNEQNYWTSITSIRKTGSNAHWDGDGTAAAALDMSENNHATQFYQEIRGNFSNSKMNGVLGGSYWWEKADQRNSLAANEQHLASFILLPEPIPVGANGLPETISISEILAEYGLTDSIPLPTNHQEANYSSKNSMAAEGFLDISYQLTRKIFVSAGVRALYDRYELNSSSAFSGGDVSLLGAFNGNYPNVFFKPGAEQNLGKTSLAFTWHGGLKYRFNEYGNVYANYARGRRPAIYYFNASGEQQSIDPEILDNFELGFKADFYDRVFLNANGFYQLHKNLQTQVWNTDPESGALSLEVTSSGKATSYGAEASFQAIIIKPVSLFGSYAWLHTGIDSTNAGGLAQHIAGKVFRLAPEHSFNLGLHAQVKILPSVQLFITPTYSRKAHFFFDDANTPGLEQDAYGLLNINGGLAFDQPNIILSFWARNVLDQNYATSIGKTGAAFGLATFVPGPPRMIGTKLTWNFTKKQKRRSRIMY